METGDVERTSVLLDELSAGQMLVIWTARSWVSGHLSQSPVFSLLREAYTQVGAPEAVEDIDALFSTMATGCRKKLWFGSPGCTCESCRHVGLCEALIVNNLAAFQHGKPRCAACVFSNWMVPDAAASAMAPARRWSVALMAQNFPLDIIPGERLQLDRRAHLASIDPGTALVR